MLNLRNISLRRKQMLIIMLTTSTTLLLACTAFVVYDVLDFRKQLARRVSGLAEVLANNSTAALDFNDVVAAEELLSALRAEPGIVASCIYDNSGDVFGAYRRQDALQFAMPPVQAAGTSFESGRLDLYREIILNGEPIGTIYIASDLTELSRKFSRYAGIVALVFGVSLLVALVMSARLQRLVSEPILQLARVARSVAIERNYSVRARKQSDDEIGTLIDGFNEMLTQIQQRDSAVQAARDTLELRVEERTRALADSLSLLNATLNSTADGILAVDLTGRVICHNEKFVTMWNVPQDLLKGGSRNDLILHSASMVKDRDAFLARVESIRNAPESESYDLIPLKDGRTFERFIHPQRLGDQCIGCVLNFRDITERKKAEAELETIHRELVQASRHAGMAEVATNVLHNVGNVLNSVNTSASVVMDQIRSSKVTGISKMAALLEQNRHDLPGFFTDGKRAEQVFTYIKTLSQHLDSEHQTILSELNGLTRNIEHIKEIVAMQQNYAKVSGVVELYSVPSLVEDALRIHASALGRHQVEIVRAFQSVPDILLDKHKVLQILVNLIGNAKYALSDATPDKRRLTLGVQVAEAGSRIQISVADNGMGIAPENLTRIFSHGFTTRKNGHGFGLHSGFLAAREMGGSLFVNSEGLGQGATFTLELPFNHHKNHAN